MDARGGRVLLNLKIWIFSSVVLFLLLEGIEGLDDEYNVFHVPTVPSSSSSSTSRGRNANRHLFPWEQTPEKWRSNDDGPNGEGIGLKLFRRDDWNSPLITYSSSFDQSVVKRLIRDRARVHQLNEQLIQVTHATTADTAGPPLRSPVISGLDEGSGEYFTTIPIGSPSADVLFTIDTGSDLTWIQCHPCDNCYDQLGPIFNPGESQTYDPVGCYSPGCQRLPHSKCEGASCQYDVSYGDGSFTTGDFARETLTMNSTRGKPFRIHDFYFGCGHDNEGLFIASGGILGLGRGDLSFPSQISRVLTPKFSYCLIDRFSASDSMNSNPSYLYFGGSDTSHLRYTPLLRNPAVPTFYYVQMTSISVGKKVLEIPSSAFGVDASGRGGVILDSGTSVTRLSSVAYRALRDEFKANAKNLKPVEVAGQDLFDTCFEITEDQEVPIVTLHFANYVDLMLPADNVLIPVDNSGTLFCLAFAGADGRSNLSIIGNIQQQGFRIEFDLTSKPRVGFTRQDCSL
ncbi:hypothetical protein R1flu_025530 [Riccia fluitans]|uniref:Peptidase A1 domain-containing protein n=1 Tax=Riccia fluitans TaxID=41844 RepID=A0ABD1XY09_9MARC